ncbi:DUF6731 family protein [Bacillus cereus group sp. BceL215]|uniref:DUF6731 family protein n=1 Tax=Bacillus cereus group sp. BceL215 TaxID=3445015 RepID=UPI001A29644B|nr:hypothetical protein [Bacillus sp. PR5]
MATDTVITNTTNTTITKYVSFDYFTVCCKEKGIPVVGRETPFNLTTMFTILDKKSLEERTTEYKQEKARLDEIGLVGKSTTLWRLYFSRLRDFNLPNRAKKNGLSQPVDLEDDEYLGENVSAVYDEQRNILMVQRNRNSLGPGAIETYFNQFLDGKDEIVFRPIPIKNARERIKEAQYVRKLKVKFADVKKAEEVVSGVSLKKWISLFNDYDSVTGEIVVTVGRQRKASLGGNLKGLLDEVYENSELITRAQASVKKSDISDPETIDLFAENAHDVTSFTVKPRTALKHEVVIGAMEDLYERKKTELINILYKKKDE